MTGDAPRPLPVLLDVRGRHAVVLGPGSGSGRAVVALLAAGATVDFLTGGAQAKPPGPDGDPSLAIVDRGYVRGDLAGAHLALCFSDEPEVRAGFAAEAHAVGCLVHVKGAPALSTFDLQWTESDKGES